MPNITIQNLITKLEQNLKAAYTKERQRPFNWTLNHKLNSKRTRLKLITECFQTCLKEITNQDIKNLDTFDPFGGQLETPEPTPE